MVNFLDWCKHVQGYRRKSNSNTRLTLFIQTRILYHTSIWSSVVYYSKVKTGFTLASYTKIQCFSCMHLFCSEFYIFVNREKRCHKPMEIISHLNDGTGIRSKESSFFCKPILNQSIKKKTELKILIIN